MEFLQLHWAARLEVFIRNTPGFPYEAHLTNDGTQRRGYGNTPREAIIDALATDKEDQKWPNIPNTTS